MANEGDGVLNDDGDWAMDDDGNALVFDENGECAECCGEPNTCTECGTCCFSDQSVARVAWPTSTTAAGGACADECATIDGGQKDLPYIGAGNVPRTGNAGVLWQLVDAGITYTAGYDCVNDVWEYEVANSNGDTCFWTTSASIALGCCGGMAEVTLLLSNIDSPFGCTPGSGTGTLTITVLNNKCCKCDVDATPTCIPSTKDYANDCDVNDVNECNQFTGAEADCDAAPA